MEIKERLRQLRREKGMTQEQAAAQVGVTRQALSSYESGRTRPDIEMLLRLAQVYGTDLEGVLYGREREEKALRRWKILAAAVFGGMLLLALVSALLLWSANLFLPMQEGIMTEEGMAVWERRQLLFSIRLVLDTVNLILSRVGPVLLLVLSLVWKCAMSPWRKLAWVGGWAAGLALVTLPFGFADPVFGLWNYWAQPASMLGSVLFCLIVALAVDAFRARRRRARGKEQSQM